MEWIITGALGLFFVFLLYLFIKGILFIGWLFAGAVAIVLSILLAVKVIDMTGFLTAIALVILVFIIFQFFQ